MHKKNIQICFLNYNWQKIPICFLNYNLQKAYKYVFSIKIRKKHTNMFSQLKSAKKTYKYVFSIIICKKHTNIFSQFALSQMGVCTSRHSAICPFLVSFLVLSWNQIVFSGIQILFISLSRVPVQRMGTKLMMPSYKELLWGVVCLLNQ